MITKSKTRFLNSLIGVWHGKLQSVIPKMLLIILFVFTAFIADKVYTQDNEGFAVKQRNAWFYIQRAHPYDTIPSYAYANAIAEKNQLISSKGFRLTGPASNWVNLGPNPLNGIGGIVSGRISALVYDKRDLSGNTVYIAPAGGGVWKTTNGGSNWLDLSGNPNDGTGLPTLVSGAIAIDYAHNTIYYGSGTNHYMGTEYMGMGMFKTTNDGQNWIRISNNLPEQTQIFRIAIDPNDNTGNTIYIAEFHGLYKTTDGGSSWFKVLPTNGSDRMCTDICFSPDGSKIYAAGTAPDFWPGTWFNGIGYLRSTDGGVNWSGSSNGFPHSSTPHGRSCIAVSNADENVVYISSYDNSGLCPVYLYKSVDGGLNFTSYHYPHVSDYDNWDLGGNAGFNQTLRCSDYNADVLVIGMQNLYRSTNWATEWTCIGGYCNGYPHADFHTIDFNPFDQSSNKIFIGCDGGVFRSDNRGSSWSGLNPGLSLAQVWHVGSNTYNSEQLAAGLEDQDFAFKDQGTYWIDPGIHGYDGGLVHPSLFKGGRFIGNTCANRVMYYSTNSGVNFNGATNYSGSEGGWIAVVANHPDIPGTSYLVRYDYEYVNNHYYRPVHVMKTTDYGVNYNVSHVTFTHDYINAAPNALAVSESNPDFMLMALGNSNLYWGQTTGVYSRLIKSTDGGQTWQTNPPLLECGRDPIIPDRFLTHIEIDPKNEQEIYITLSGYGTGHVYRTTNGGSNWTDISNVLPSPLPNNPTNDLIIHYTSSTTKELIVACDVGVYRTDAYDLSWSALADLLPNSPVNNLDYNRLSGKLNCATYGRSVWQSQLESISEPIYVQDRLYITDNVTLNNPIIVASGGKLILGHSLVPNAFTITFNNGAKIVVENGGEIMDSGHVPITLTSSSTWSGIEIQGNNSAFYLNNITFLNTETPIVIDGGAGAGGPVLVDRSIVNCSFTNAPIQITNRKNVNVNYCTWTFTGGSNGDAVLAVGADELYLCYSDITYNSQLLGSHAIQFSQCNDATVTHNTIHNADYPITVSNATSYVRLNQLTTSSPSTAYEGIVFNGVSNGHLLANNVDGYQTAYKLVNQSSPVMYLTNAAGSNENGDRSALYCENYSSPRLVPTITEEGELIWDAGKNVIRNTGSSSNGLFLTNNCTPSLDYGYNTIFGGMYNIFGTDYPRSELYARCNSWDEDPPSSSKFAIPGVTIYYTPYNCTPPEGASRPRDIELENPDPPAPIIVNYGNGLIDTFKVSHSNIQVSADKRLLAAANKDVYMENFQSAMTKFRNVIQNYRGTSSAIQALDRLFYCYTRTHADTTVYNHLRTYLRGQASSSPADTMFSKTASELSRKCLIKIREYVNAINEYEHLIQNSSDSADIIPAEISIVEIYLMMSSGGDSPGFTGELSYLKPSNLKDALNMIRQKLNHLTRISNVNNLPTVFSLSQNYPNPFNPYTKINYAIPKLKSGKTNVSLKVYDILGRLVKTLVNEPKEPGYYTVQFDGSSLASGVYFYKIEAGDFVQSKKMVLIK